MIHQGLRVDFSPTIALVMQSALSWPDLRAAMLASSDRVTAHRSRSRSPTSVMANLVVSPAELIRESAGSGQLFLPTAFLVLSQVSFGYALRPTRVLLGLACDIIVTLYCSQRAHSCAFWCSRRSHS